MKVILPDDSELELPDGSTGLDAARAIGPKLAEQAVLLRSNGAVRDLRLPVEDGERIQILTTRDKNDPDALYAEWSEAPHLGRLTKPEDKEWGMREMTYSDPDGNLLRIGRLV